MKVLFAVSNESISEAITKKYQQMYKEIISSKNVYYFNAIIKELQKDKSYDRIIISEDLEPFASKNYDTIDNFLFEKLDSISDEASNGQGEDIPIILISTDRRTKGENLLVKLFGIGVYSALIGQDRSIEQVCNLINKPRSKKEAKIYYKISSGGVEYKAESEGDVSEIEIQNILAHYKRLGKNEEKYIESFNSISNQYTDQQLRLIIKFLPLNVKAVLEEGCPKYQQVVASSGGNLSDGEQNTEYKNSQSKFIKKQEKQQKTNKRAEKAGLKIESIKSEASNTVLSKPVIIPSEVTTKNIKKVEQKISNMENNRLDQVDNKTQEKVQMQRPEISKKTQQQVQRTKEIVQDTSEEVLQAQMQRRSQIQKQEEILQEQKAQVQKREEIVQAQKPQVQKREEVIQAQKPQQEETIQNKVDSLQTQQLQRQQNVMQEPMVEPQIINENVNQIPAEQQTVVEQPKRGRGRPKKVLTEEEIAAQANVVKRKRGRPKKVQVEDISSIQENQVSQADESILPGFEDLEVENSNMPKAEELNDFELPGFENLESQLGTEFESNNTSSDTILPEFEEFNEKSNSLEFEDFNEQISDILPGFEENNNSQQVEINNYNEANDGMLPGFDDYEEKSNVSDLQESNSSIMPGFEEFEIDESQSTSSFEDSMLPGFDDNYIEEDNYSGPDGMFPEVSKDYNEEENIVLGNNVQEDNIQTEINNYSNNIQENTYNANSSIPNYGDQQNSSQDFQRINNYNENQYNSSNYESEQIDGRQMSTQNINNVINEENLISGDRKIVGFVGTSKNGTSFIVDNLAQMLSRQGIKTAILDLTQNKNAYYIYTKNEEDLRKIAMDCMKNLELGMAKGITVNPNLDVYTSLPGEDGDVENIDSVISTLMKQYSLVLVDCDFKSNYQYISQLQEIYLVQSMDVLTIQPLTAYLRDLKAKGILDQSKLRIVINKYLRVRSLTEKTIIGGMAFYNDPAMSFMTELFNRETIKYTVIPFETQAYSKYLEGLVNCDISLNGYSKEMLAELKKLANMVYPLVSNNQKYGKEYNKKQKAQYGQYQKNFSNEMNNTLNKMKNNY